MVNYSWVMKMSSRYKFTEEEIEAIRTARKKNKNKRVETRLKALQLRAEGGKAKEVAEKTGYNPGHITHLVQKYREGGLEAIAGNHYAGNRRNMSIEEEEKLLAPFLEQSEKGQIVVVNEIKAAYERAVGHAIGGGQIYCVLRRHKWRKVMPRSRHPKKASAEDIESSKKLTQSWQNFGRLSTENRG